MSNTEKQNPSEGEKQISVWWDSGRKKTTFPGFHQHDLMKIIRETPNIPADNWTVWVIIYSLDARPNLILTLLLRFTDMGKPFIFVFFHLYECFSLTLKSEKPSNINSACLQSFQQKNTLNYHLKTLYQQQLPQLDHRRGGQPERLQPKIKLPSQSIPPSAQLFPLTAPSEQLDRGLEASESAP